MRSQNAMNLCRALVLVACVGWVTGCAPTQEVVQWSDTGSQDEFHRSVQGEEVVVTLHNTHAYEGTMIESRAESLVVFVKREGIQRSVPVTDVASVRLKPARFGYGLVGALAGLGLGVAVAGNNPEESDNETLAPDVSTSVAGVFTPVLGAVVGFAGGTVVGQLAQPDTVFRFHHGALGLHESVHTRKNGGGVVR